MSEEKKQVFDEKIAEEEAKGAKAEAEVKRAETEAEISKIIGKGEEKTDGAGEVEKGRWLESLAACYDKGNSVPDKNEILSEIVKGIEESLENNHTIKKNKEKNKPNKFNKPINEEHDDTGEI